MEILGKLERESIIFLWWEWYFLKIPREILKAWKNFLKFGLNYFSIPLLLKTYFSHWHGYKWSYPRGLDIPKMLEVWASNLISRVLGAFIRTFVIGFGLIFEIFVLILGPIFLFGWLFFPLLLIFIFLYGWRLLF